MTKRETTTARRHRWTWLVHLMYGAAVVLALAYGVLLLGDFPERLANLAFALCSSLPLAAYVLDVIHTNESEEDA